MQRLKRYFENLRREYDAFLMRAALTDEDASERMAEMLYPYIYQAYLNGTAIPSVAEGCLDATVHVDTDTLTLYIMPARGRLNQDFDHEACWITLNGRMAHFFAEGVIGLQFERTYPLRIGDNDLTIHLQDTGGGENTYHINVLWDAYQRQSSSRTRIYR